MTIAVDFDGTIVHHRYPAIGKPVPFALETLEQLIADGHKLILWTVREGKLLDDAVDYCRQHGVEFYAVNAEYPDAGWSGSGVSRKIRADVYIDDRNLGGIPDWSEIYAMISGKSHDKGISGWQAAESEDGSPGVHTMKHKHESLFKRLARRSREARRRFNR